MTEFYNFLLYNILFFRLHAHAGEWQKHVNGMIRRLFFARRLTRYGLFIVLLTIFNICFYIAMLFSGNGDSISSRLKARGKSCIFFHAEYFFPTINEIETIFIDSILFSKSSICCKWTANCCVKFKAMTTCQWQCHHLFRRNSNISEWPLLTSALSIATMVCCCVFLFI